MNPSTSVQQLVPVRHHPRTSTLKVSTFTILFSSWTSPIFWFPNLCLFAAIMPIPKISHAIIYLDGWGIFLPILFQTRCLAALWRVTVFGCRDLWDVWSVWEHVSCPRCCPSWLQAVIILLGELKRKQMKSTFLCALPTFAKVLISQNP